MTGSADDKVESSRQAIVSTSSAQATNMEGANLPASNQTSTVERNPASPTSPTSGAVLATSFVVFERLPIQVRNMISALNLNLQEPRLVEMVYNDDEEEWYGTAKTITNLHVCREWRQQALETYPMSFAVFGAPAVTPFNFQIDTLLLGRRLMDTHQKFRNYTLNDDLAKVQLLMVDASLKWGVRTHNERKASGLGRLSHHVFTGLRKHTVLYIGNIDPISEWFNASEFVNILPIPARLSRWHPQNTVSFLKNNWPFKGRALDPQLSQLYRHGGLEEKEKRDFAIMQWRIPEICSIGVTPQVIDSCISLRTHWAEVLMDRAIEDIFK